MFILPFFPITPILSRMFAECWLAGQVASVVLYDTGSRSSNKIRSLKDDNLAHAELSTRNVRGRTVVKTDSIIAWERSQVSCPPGNNEDWGLYPGPYQENIFGGPGHEYYAYWDDTGGRGSMIYFLDDDIRATHSVCPQSLISY